ncbi:hypothetical protein DEJ23_04335 [Curtobacterium sp. MCSS17_008]|uniref:hypothetical protein n=1 Tax=Curtobacterium sp. MCSS17_008 TaxID=2175647 RepID=UPI000DA77FA0|nr:hypothetical protein [Curtobacterium sp. MCSS17_008]PZF59002.1 hypothetical protein DEJ23_04335 [Curtobacterium sp. MCSS17_008]
MTRSWNGLRRALAAVLVGSVAAATAWARLGPVARGTVWAEDGGVFFREHLALGSLPSIVHPYAGYLHLVPRMVVDAAFLVPVPWYAVAVSAICCALTGAVCAGVFVLAADVVPSAPLRVVLAAVPVLLPTAPWEVLGNAANLHTFALFLAPWVLSHRTRTWWGSALLGLVAVLVVGTEVQAILFLPLLVLAWQPWRTVPRASRLRALPVTLAALVAAAAQLVTATTTERESAPGDPSVRDVVTGYLLQTLGGLWRADVAAVGRSVVASGWGVLVVPAVLVAAVVVIAAVVAVRDGRPRAAVLSVVLAAGSAVVWTAALVANASANGHWSRADPTALVVATPSRYAAAAGLLLSAALVVAASVLVDRVLRRPATDGRSAAATTRRVLLAGVGWVVVAGLVTSWVVAFPGVAQRSSGPAWRPQFTDAVAQCRREPDGAVRIETQPWGARVPCALVLADGQGEP